VQELSKKPFWSDVAARILSCDVNIANPSPPEAVCSLDEWRLYWNSLDYLVEFMVKNRAGKKRKGIKNPRLDNFDDKDGKMPEHRVVRPDDIKEWLSNAAQVESFAGMSLFRGIAFPYHEHFRISVAL